MDINLFTLRKEMHEQYIAQMQDNISDVIEYNLFWIFWRNTSWFQAPVEYRIVDVYLSLELKKMIEYTSLAKVLQEDKSLFKKMVKNYSCKFEKTWQNKIRDTIGIEEFESRAMKMGIDIPIVWGGKCENILGMNQMVCEYLPSFSAIYKKLNYIQHDSLVPSAQSKILKWEMFNAARELTQIMHNLIIQIYGISGFEKQKMDSWFYQMNKNL